MNKLNFREKLIIKLMLLLIEFLSKSVEGFYPREPFKEILKELQGE